MIKTVYISIYLLWWCVFAPLLPAAPALNIPGHLSQSIGEYLELMEDPAGAWTIQEVSQTDRLLQFKPALTSSPNLGLTNSTYWLRFKVRFQHNQSLVLEISYPFLDYVDLFVPQTNGTFEKYQTGDQMPFSHRQIEHRFLLFHLEGQAGEEISYYLRVQTAGAMTIPVKLWSPEAFTEKVNKEQYALGFYYGIMVVMAVYNLFLFFAIRDKAYLFYVMYILFLVVSLMCANGLAFEYLWPDFPLLNNISLPIFMIGTGIFGLSFLQHFLSTSIYTPVIHKILRILQWLFALGLLLMATMGYTVTIKYNVVLVSVTVILGIVTAIRCWQQHLETARYFLIAWVMFLLGTFIYMMKVMGYVPSSLWTEYAPQVGSVIEVVLLSLGLAHRIHLMRKEKEQAQHEMVLNQKIANETLEMNVRERTLELQNSNEKLSHSNQIFRSLLETSASIAQAKKLEDMYHQTLNRLTHLYENLGFGIILDGVNSSRIECAVFAGITPEKQEILLGKNEKLFEYCIQSIISASQDNTETGTVPYKDFFSELTIIPMIDINDNVIGKMIIEGTQLGKHVMDTIMLFLDQITAISQNQLLTKRLEKMANTDSLTGSFNRAYFDRELSKAIRTAQKFPEMSFSILMIDVNGLKEINDQYGHQSGDQMIIQVANLLSSVCRKSEVVARVGGDEFVVLCLGANHHGASVLLQRIREHELKNILRIHDEENHEQEIPIHMSIGVSSSDEAPPEDVMKIADARMYEDKELFYSTRSRYR
ncbi:MAG: GGDEF domain-containing protein [SAR324 cluster bacterium]|nr:GGDEF domain-containing protein [SAR324 cluster bacterium]